MVAKIVTANKIAENNNEPFAKLVAISKSEKKRIAGLNRGDIWISDDFDEPLPDEFCERRMSK